MANGGSSESDDESSNPKSNANTGDVGYGNVTFGSYGLSRESILVIGLIVLVWILYKIRRS